MKLLFVVGARPQFVKSASVIHEILKNHPDIELQLIHSGQHYDFEMSTLFFRDLEIPQPLLNLASGSGSHAAQTSRIMTRLENCILKNKPNFVLTPGDANTTLATAITAIKLDLPVGHIEAGLRSFDLTMPEEVNRRLTDHCSTLLFCPTETARGNLLNEGISQDKIFLVGDTMVDALQKFLPRIKTLTAQILKEHVLKPWTYVTLTMHRPENVDNPVRFKQILEALLEISKRTRIIFPIHPRTFKNLKGFRYADKIKKAKNIVLTDPVGYVEMLCLMGSSSLIITDSGGIQKEAFMLRVPCLTLRYITEWPETLKLGANTLVGAETELIKERAFALIENKTIRKRLASLPNPFGDGRASKRIVNIIEERFEEGSLSLKPISTFKHD